MVVLVAVVVGALLLKVVHPIIVLVGFVGGVAYVNYRLKAVVKTEARGDAIAILGLRRETHDPFGLLGYPFALFGRGPDPRVEDLVWGTWRGIDVRRFDVSFEHPLDGPQGERPRFACAIAPLGGSVPHLVVEPVTFVMRLASEVPMPQVATRSERLERAFSVRCEDPAFAAELFDEHMVDWLDALGEDQGFEVSGSLALLYGPASPAADVVTVLEVLQGFIERVPAGLRQGASGSSDPPPSASVET